MSHKRAKPDKSAMSPTVAKSKPSRTGRSIHVYVDPAIADALDRFMESQRLPPSMTSVVELALKSFLKGEGFVVGEEEN